MTSTYSKKTNDNFEETALKDNIHSWKEYALDFEVRAVNKPSVDVGSKTTCENNMQRVIFTKYNGFSARRKMMRALYIGAISGHLHAWINRLSILFAENQTF